MIIMLFNTFNSHLIVTLQHCPAHLPIQEMNADLSIVVCGYFLSTFHSSLLSFEWVRHKRKICSWKSSQLGSYQIYSYVGIDSNAKYSKSRSMAYCV